MDFANKNKIEINEVLELLNTYKNKTIIDHNIKNKIYNRCKSIIDHDEWYSDDDRNSIYQTACNVSFFTEKQKNALSYSSIVKNYNEEYVYDGATSDEDRRWRD